MRPHPLNIPFHIKAILLLSIASLSACSPTQQHTQTVQSIQQPTQTAPLPEVNIPIPVQPKFATKLHKIEENGINFNLVSFDARDYSLEVADQPNGPGTLWADAETVAEKKNAIAALNAGFFTPEGKPLGLVIENGVKRGAYNASSLGKGIYYTTGSETKIQRSGDWRNILQKKPKQLLQAGPMLVDKGISTKGLSTQNSRPRSFLATDGNNHWIIGHASSSTLSQLGKALDHLKIGDFEVVYALNLDGGRSSDLWVSAEIANGPLEIRPFWNKSVRNFVILRRK